MQTSNRKATDSKPDRNKEKSSKDDLLTKKPLDDKLKKTIYSVSTPRNFVPKSTTADIYAQKKKNNTQSAVTPKKIPGTTSKSSNVSPMKDLLKSSPSSVSQISSKFRNSPISKNEAKAPNTARHATPRTAKDLPFVNVTVNSPIAKKKLVQDGGKMVRGKSFDTKEVKKRSSDVATKEAEERKRSKTRTLNENEIKVLTPDAVDNNAEMISLSRKLTAKPKVFYVDLEESKEKPQNDKTSEDEVSYEDDFDSYESDFESEHESQSEHSEHNSDEHTPVALKEISENERDSEFKENGGKTKMAADDVDAGKDVKDDEKMMDSGNFELRDSRSATKAKLTMQFILEDGEPDVRSSLTDEGFQEMSSSGSSIKTVHTDVIDRPLFIDFKKSVNNKRKKKILERLKQRAKDILSMVTLHEMSYSLFEMKPIPYDLYMATFGRSNYTQTACQTFDDGITVEVQTEELLSEERWTQHPVDFSKHDIYMKTNVLSQKYSHNIEDYLTKFTILINNKSDVENNNQINLDDDYKRNPLRVYLEQKDGVGTAEMLPYETYKSKLKNNDFNAVRLGRFIKKYESRISHILSANTGADVANLTRTSKYPFSKGYVVVSPNDITDERIQIIKQAKVTGVVLSETNSNLVLTIHNKASNQLDDKCVICLWNVSVAIRDPLKILIAISDISIARFRGSTDGIFVGGMEDCSVHLWDLSEGPTWRQEVNEETTGSAQTKDDQLTETEREREWNSKNRHVGFKSTPLSQYLLQACSYTTSASAMKSGPNSPVTGLVVDTRSTFPQDDGRRVLGQVCALQQIGIITIWSIIQEKLKSSQTDMGKAYWSKMKLEKNQTISLTEQIGLPSSESMENVFKPTFDLSAAKRRTSMRKKGKSLRRQPSRPKSAANFDSDRPLSVAIKKNIDALPEYNWESGIVCTDLKMIRLNDNDNYLVGKNCGEVLCCTKNVGVLKINRFCISTDLSTVTTLELSPHALPYFLAATDTGTLNLCSLLDNRVLLTLDCRNSAPPQDLERYQVDSKGRFLGTSQSSSSATYGPTAGVAVKCMFWCPTNPCCILALLDSNALLTWELMHSDIHATSANQRAASSARGSGTALALLTPEGEAHIHRLHSGPQDQQHLELFKKYVALL